MMEEAVLRGDLKQVQELIRRGEDVNKPCRYSLRRTSKEGSLLHLAIDKCCDDIALALLAAGADVHAKDKGGWTPLHWACFMGCKEVVQALVDRGARVNERDWVGRTPLMVAHEGGDGQIMMCLLRAGADCEGLEEECVGSLFCHACCEHDLLAVWIILKNGCSVSILSTEEQEQLLHLACHECDVFVAHTLFKNGCSVSILSTEEQELLLHLACRKSDVFVAHTLFNNGCSVSILSTEEQEHLLHLACHESGVFVAHALFKNGCSVSILSTEEQEQLLHLACCESDVFVIRMLLKNGCSVRKLTKEDLLYLVHSLSKQEVEELLRHACHEGSVFVVHTLVKNGYTVSILSTEEQEELLHCTCSENDAFVGSVFVAHTLFEKGCSAIILSTEEQEHLLHLACCEGDVFVARTLLKNGCSISILSTEEQELLLYLACHKSDAFVVHTLLENGCSVSTLSREEQEELMRNACHEGDVLIVEAVLDSGCSMNCAYSNGVTPLMVATEKGHEKVVKKLILAGANLRMQTTSGDTALHIAASSNNIECGILMTEGGASVRTKNNLAQTPLDLAKAEFKVATKQALSFTTRKALCIIGNAEGGKSTLIAALQAESNSFLGKMVNRLKRVNDRRQRTAGIEIVPHCSKRYGEVLFFDFAGQHEYHGPHQMFMESLLSKPGVSMTFLLVVKMTEEEDAILHQLHRWLSPVALMATPASPPHVIIIGSFLDKVKSKEEATAKLTRCMEATKKDLEELPLEFVGTTFLNCRQPQSTGIDHICKFLQEIPIPEFRAAHTRYSLAWILSQIKLSLISQAVELKEFSKWVQENRNNLPRQMPPPAEVCQDLSAAGHALYLPNREDPLKSWLVLDLPSILHDVYGTLFSQYREIVNEFGLLQCHHLAELFPHLDLEMVQHLLISLEFCLPVDPLILKVDLSELTQCEENNGWLFFPALISSKHSQSTLDGPPQQSVRYLCWQLRTSKKHFISARLLQTILLRLAAHFVVKQCDEEGVQQHCCSIWWNGISWQSRKGIDIIVHIINNRVIQVIGASHTSADKSCQYLTDVISDILATVHRLSPRLAAGAYIVYPPRKSASSEDITAPSPKELFPMEGIRSSVGDNEEDSLSLKDNITDRCTTVAVSDLFGGYTPSLEDIERICWMQPEANQTQSSRGTSQPESSHPESSQADILSQTVHSEFSLLESSDWFCALHYSFTVCVCSDIFSVF